MSDKLTETEIQELQEKKKQIREELYDQVKEEMFKASSALEGMTPEQALDEMVRIGEELGLYDDPADIRFAIKVKIDTDDWVYVTKCGGRDYLKREIQLFDSFLKAKEVADSFRIEGKEKNVKVVRYVE
jgi:hypothetical protein